MSFIEREDVFSVVENFIKDSSSVLSDKYVMDNKFYSMSYDEALENY
jgi:aspartyl-tRNA synthetase